MEMNDSTKRKAPEPEEAPAASAEAAPAEGTKREAPEPVEKPDSEMKPAADAAAGAGAAAAAAEAAGAGKAAEEKASAEKPGAKAAAAAASDSAPSAKRLKPTPPEPKTVRKQIEYYLSDENLRYDKFFSEKISTDKDGWLDMALVLSCNKMKSMRATKEDVLEALKESKLELREDGSAIRRPGNAPLPKLEAKPQHHQKKPSIHAHNGGVMARLSKIPEEQGWMQVKEKLKDKLPAKVQLWFVSEVTEQHTCIISVSPFNNDIKFFEELDFELGGAKIASEVCYDEVLQQGLKLLPKHVRDKRERESRKRQKERNRPIMIGMQKFVNVPTLRGRVKEILNSRSEGEALKVEGTDFKLIKELLKYHPKGAEKTEGMVGIKVAKSPQGDNRCFYMIKEGGVEEDFSAKKCLDAVELDPPYAKVETKEAAAPAEAGKPKEPKKKEEGAEAPPAKASDAAGAAAAAPAAEEAAPAPAASSAADAAAPGDGAPATAAVPAAEAAAPAAEAAAPAAAADPAPAAATSTDGPA